MKHTQNIIPYFFAIAILAACGKAPLETQVGSDKKAALEHLSKPENNCKYKMNGEPVIASPECPSKKK
jgi:outer membrane biogenesis lipoprotein LolB